MTFLCPHLPTSPPFILHYIAMLELKAVWEDILRWGGICLLWNFAILANSYDINFPWTMTFLCLPPPPMAHMPVIELQRECSFFCEPSHFSLVSFLFSKLHEIDVGLTDELTSEDLECDVVCLMYDISDPRTFEYCARMYKVSRHKLRRTSWAMKTYFSVNCVQFWGLVSFINYS